MTDLALIQQTEQSLAALKAFAEQSRNDQLLEHIQRLEAGLRAFAAGGAITVGDISGSTAVAIGRNINLIVNQVLPAEVRQPLENVQKQWSAAHLEVRRELERSQGGHIFLSYTRADMEAARQVRRALEQAGHAVWQDLTAIKGGDEWVKSIETGVERCYALVTLVSEPAKKSEWVQIEYLHAKRRGKLIVPLKVDDSEIPTLMLATNVLHGHPDLAEGIRQLLAALPAPPPVTIAPPPVDRRALELRYLDGLLLEHSVWQEVYTPMAGVGQLCLPREQKADAPAGRLRMKTVPAEINVVYHGRRQAGEVPCDEAQQQVEPKRYEADLLPAVAEMRRLVILGEPGAGKTTTLWKILSDCALKAKDDPAAPLPVLVRLGSLGEAGLQAALQAQLGALGGHYAALLAEKRLVFLLDGLNELPAASRESRLQEIQALFETCRQADLLAVVTCRELDYSGALDLGLPGRVSIQPLDPARIRQFVNAYLSNESGKGDELFLQLAGDDVQNVWQKWQQAGASLELFFTAKDIPRTDPDVYSRTSGQDDNIWSERVRDQVVLPRSMLALAANPYMLYMITQVFTDTGTLPRNRGLLFETFIDYLLEKRERLPQAEADELKMRLAVLAYAMQAEGEGTSFASARALAHLASERCLYRARSASLLGGGDEVRFTHQLLQEYFAARHLQGLMAQTPAVRLFPPENWWQPQGWEETLVLLAGLYSDDCRPVVDWLQAAQPEVAARCIVESGAHCPDETLARLRAAWLPRLTDLAHDPEPRARAAVGRALGRLQLGGAPLDNRKGVSVVFMAGQALPDLDWVEIPGGPFIYQENEQRSEPAFYMARYPVTFTQFQAFLDDPQGFTNPRWWGGLAAADEHKRAPGEQEFKFSSHPRETVSWYDALAFCRWLTATAQVYPELLPQALRGQAGCEIGLPTEWQWEKAARGQDGREYPYKGSFDPEKGNTGETGIDQTSAVGIFPQGASPYGLLELSGNVWEWCLNEYEQPEKVGLAGDAARVLRGGSWSLDQDHARAVYRDRSNPNSRGNYNGFRLVVRPPSLGNTDH